MLANRIPSNVLLTPSAHCYVALCLSILSLCSYGRAFTFNELLVYLNVLSTALFTARAYLLSFVDLFLKCLILRMIVFPQMC